MAQGRIQSIDALRGISIFGMIFSAAIGWHSGLPDWMFHCQVPPPDYVFRPEVRGITWVDIVFPFFIFSLGAAIPLALGRRLEKGESLLKVSLSIVKRWAVLVAFALAIGHASAIGGLGFTPLQTSLVGLGLWLAMFAALLRTSRWWVNLAGWLALAAGFAALHFCCGLKIDKSQNDCIILLLSTVSLLGGFIWLLTRNSLPLRCVFWLAAVGTRLIGWGFAMYLVIALPATIVGDILRKGDGKVGAIGTPAALVAICAVLVQLWGLYTRSVLTDGIVSVALCALFVLLTFRDRSGVNFIGWMGFLLLLAGIAFDPLDGGIAKDYCNMSYLLVTGGQATLTLYFLMWIESRVGLGRNITMTGQNPMIAYTIAWAVVSPLLYAVGLLGWLDGACTASPALALLRGLVVTLGMMALTCLCTRFKIFWRS